jgi:hypothetical protein
VSEEDLLNFGNWSDLKLGIFNPPPNVLYTFEGLYE